MWTYNKSFTNKGLTFLEVIITLFLFAVSVVGFSQVFSAALDTNYRANQELIATNLAMALADEILTKHFEDPTEPGNPLGTDTGENQSDRKTLDDVDDYNTYKDGPPDTAAPFTLNNTLMDGETAGIPDYSDFSREVTVIYVEYLEDGSYIEYSEAPPELPTDYKKITVTASGPYVRDISISATKAKP